ncbi:MAG TPA: hypothetical protein VHT24_02625 [Pseudacidobacterium sp.]|jgi:hypothetical protein|nr:hypothetical protein [Pseudacidobacterium sp.]
MPVEFAPQWLSAGADHLKTQQQALSLIKSAADVLESSTSVEIMFWASAAKSGAINLGSQGNFLRVFKDLHQEEGIFRDLVHMTMSLKIMGKTGQEREHSLYGGAFHLYIKILDPVVGKTKHHLQPSHLSYKSGVGDKEIVGVDIKDAAALDSERT